MIKAIKILLEAGAYQYYILRHGLAYKSDRRQEKLVVSKGELIKRAHEIGRFDVKKTMGHVAKDY